MSLLVPGVAIELDKPRELRFSIGAVKRFQLKTGKNVLDEETFKALGREEWPTLIWVCLDRKGRDELTPEDLEDMLGFAALNESMGKVIEAFNLSAGIVPSEGGAERPPAEGTDGTGN